LPLELALGPVTLETLVFVDGAFPRVFEPDQIREMRPRKFEQLLDRQRAGLAVARIPNRRCGSVARRFGRFPEGQFPHQRCGNPFRHLGIVQVKEPHTLQHVGAGTGHLALPQIRRNPFQQTGPVFSPVLAGLLELDEIGTNQPVPKDEVTIDRAGSPGLGLPVGVADDGDEGWVVHVPQVRKSSLANDESMKLRPALCGPREGNDWERHFGVLPPEGEIIIPFSGGKFEGMQSPARRSPIPLSWVPGVVSFKFTRPL